MTVIAQLLGLCSELYNHCYVVWALPPRLFSKSNDFFPLRPLQKDVSNAV